MFFLIFLIILTITALIIACIAYWKVSRSPQISKLRPIDTISLKTVNYNIFGRWNGVTGYEGQDTRLENIPYAILANPKLGPDVDVITFEEAWCPNNQLFSGAVMCAGDKSRDLLTQAMIEAGWKYHTQVIDKPGVSVVDKPANGGAIIFSKWPILATSQYVYTKGLGQDKDAAKGVIYVRIKKTQNGISQIFNIFGTHLQAWSTPEGKKGRQNELREIHDTFLPAIGIPQNGTEVVLYQGDMNTDYVLYPEEVEEMQTILKAKLPQFIGDQLYSSDPSTNYLVGKDGAAEQDGCLSEYESQLKGNNGIVPLKPTATCSGKLSVPSTTNAGGVINSRFLDPSTNRIKVPDPCTAYCPCCPHEMLDYILYSTESHYLQPLRSTLEIVPLKSVQPLTYKWGWCDGAACIVDKKESHDLTGSDLSDHYPVVANFTFRPITQTFDKIDGCKSDNDCHWKPFGKVSCYCTGSKCTLNNKKVNGWDLGGANKVNKNCQFRASAKGTCFCRPGNQ